MRSPFFVVSGLIRLGGKRVIGFDLMCITVLKRAATDTVICLQDSVITEKRDGRIPDAETRFGPGQGQRNY